MRYCHQYLPTGQICEVENGICFGTFATEADALAWEAVSIKAPHRGNYRIVPLPYGMRDGCEEARIHNEKLDSRASQKARFLTGPRGVMGDGTEVTSEFRRYHRDSGSYHGWQWVARDKSGNVMHVIEMPDRLAGFHNDRTGALWTLRDIADAQVCRVPVRCQREH